MLLPRVNRRPQKHNSRDTPIQACEDPRNLRL
jgi:hypothetical protein